MPLMLVKYFYLVFVSSMVNSFIFNISSNAFAPLPQDGIFIYFYFIIYGALFPLNNLCA